MARTRKAFKKSDSQTRFIPDDASTSMIIVEKPEQKITLSQFRFFPDQCDHQVEQSPKKEQEEVNSMWSKACSPQNVS